MSHQASPAGSVPAAAAVPRPFPSIWAFIAIDCMGFAIFFAVFMSERISRAALFDESSRQLDARLGLINTLILICSGWLVALAAAAARSDDRLATRRRLLAAVTVGAGFAVIKVFEYATKISAGITPLSNDFFGYYFALTGVHFLHYLIGVGALLVTISKLGRGGDGLDDDQLTWVESGGVFWHMVDLLWVFLFPMLYLLGAAR